MTEGVFVKKLYGLLGVPPVGFEPTTCGLKVRSSDLTELKGLTKNKYIMLLDVLQIAMSLPHVYGVGLTFC